jgi:hypothetical protein
MTDSLPMAHTTDVDEARDLIRRSFFETTMDPLDGRPLAIRFAATQLPRLSVGCLHLGGEVAMYAADLPAYQIAVALSGRAVNRWTDGHSDTVTNTRAAAVYAPAHPLTSYGHPIAGRSASRSARRRYAANSNCCWIGPRVPSSTCPDVLT